MLFRRIKAHIAKEDWFAVFIDFIIVVFGVFMGFQVQQWNEARSEQDDGKQYLQRLVTDLDLSIERNDEQVANNRTTIEHLDVVLTSLDSCQLKPSDQKAFVTGLYSLGKIDMPILVMGTIDELNATGNFRLIGDLDLRRMITEAVRGHQTILAIDNQIISRIMPGVNYVREHVRFNLGSHHLESEQVETANVYYNFEELCDDSKFIFAIATVREMTLANILFNEQSRDSQKELKTALEEELSRDELSD